MMDGMVKRVPGRPRERGFAARTVFVPGRTLGRSLDAYARAKGLSKSDTLRELLTIGLAAKMEEAAEGGLK